MTTLLHRLANLARALVLLGFALGVVLMLAVLGLAWRLGQGPVDLAWALPRIEAALNRPGASTRLTLAGATIAWPGYTAGAVQDLRLALRGLALDDGGPPLIQADTIDVSLAPAGLLRLQALPRAIEASGIVVHLVRARDGAVALDLRTPDPSDDPSNGSDPSPPDLAETIRELTRPPRAAGAGPIRSKLQELQQLGHLRLTNAVAILHDRAMGGFWRLDLTSLVLDRQQQGGVLGRADATLGLGIARAHLTMQAALAPSGGTSLQLVLAPIGTDTMQRAAEAQGAVVGGDNGLDTALQGSATLLLDPALQPSSAAIQLAAGAGRVRVTGTTIGFDSLNLDATAGWATPGWTRPDTAAISRLKAVIHAPGGSWPSTILASGTLRRDGERLAGTAAASVDHLAFTDIGQLWPEPLGGHIRPWLVKSVSAGTARDAAVTLAFNLSSSLDKLVVTAIDGSVAGDDTTIHWLRPVPPVEHAQALLTIRSPEVMDIAVLSARQGAMPLTNGTIHITGLNVKDQFLNLEADGAGQVAEIIQLLRNPHLQLLSRKPIPMRNPGGAFAGHLHVFLPLNEDLDFDDVKLGIRARATDLRLGGLVAGHDLDHGDIQVDATSETLKAQGRATIAGLPSDLLVEMDFRNGGLAQTVQRAQATTRATPQQLAAAGIDTAGIIEAGQGTFTGRYIQRRDSSAELAVTANLRDAALAFAGWTKPPGSPAEAGARLLLRGDRLVGLDQLHAQAPGLAIDGRADMVADRPLLLSLDRLTLGGTQATGDIQLPSRPADPIRARLQGAVLDLSALLARKPGKPATPPASTNEASWIADLSFDRLILAANRPIVGVTAHAESTGGRITALRAQSTGPEKLNATIDRTAGPRTLTVTAADGGALLRALDLVDSVQGGAMTLKATYDDTRPEPPLRGTMELNGFRVRNAPGLGKLLQAVTVYGVFEALSGPGLSFSRLSMPFYWNGTVLEVADVEAFSASLGLTARGRIDSARNTIDMQGTVVPLYVINSMLGRIPLVGRLFSAEKGGGLLAVNYALRGPVADPSVSVNPLSALTPGFLRGLFKVLE